ncbi:Na/Pi-cotransporter [Moorella sp. E308F]|uniref:Na/Pi cotransporter family protein n=1 Tax=unclassified Neomoorella TaxID=2676739 RepID=UPI0010FFAFBF|nr:MULTISPECIES: Na/Pi symporter [unclassified Moorella (in: firmicutes)]GEA16684.1 Na/Pi-cotransporter [Moorella sp. E308F]GEA17127.1 Na/Pi-cotransporter [Moorella sp. E306M]
MLFPLLQFAAGVSLLLLGVQLLRRGLVALGRSYLEIMIRRATATPWQGFIWGTLATALVQSSTAVTVLTVGLVDGGAISFYQSLGVILGANVGTCVTVQFLSLNLSKITLPLLVVGIPLILVPSSRAAGTACAGTGLIFFSLDLMTSSLLPFRDSPALLGLLSIAAASPWQGILAGTLLTGLLHSSSVVAGMAMVLAGHGVLPPSGALHIVLGANIGTCLTALIAALFSSRAAKRTALAHLVINVTGAILCLPFLPLILQLLTWLTPDLPRQVAHFHTLFNLVSSLAALPFTSLLARLLETLLPG